MALVLINLLSSAEAENRPKSAHRYNVAEQQNVYRSEIERIWKAQYDSLSRKEEPQLTAEDEERYNASVNAQKQLSRGRSRLDDDDNRGSVPPMSPSYSRASSLDREVSLGPESSHRVLRVKRLVSNRLYLRKTETEGYEDQR